jgi:hypothetical protein
MGALEDVHHLAGRVPAPSDSDSLAVVQASVGGDRRVQMAQCQLGDGEGGQGSRSPGGVHH